jgi:hypothetical protein
LWSIGCVIYELCELRPPFQGKDLDELYENVCKGEPERINKVYSDDLWKMILMLLQVDVNKRVDCNQFLNSELIKKKIEEMKNNPSTFLEALNLDRNKGIKDDFLLKTIKFNDISEIKAQLPTKKNYNNYLNGNNFKYPKNKRIINRDNIIDKHKFQSKINTNIENINEEYLNKLKDIKKEKELIKKELAKQIEYGKIREYINKNNERMKNKEKEKKNLDALRGSFKKQRIGNIIKDNYDNLLKYHKTVIYKKTNCYKNRYQTAENNKNSFIKSNHPEIDISNIGSSKKLNGINSERRKKTDLSELYLKKYAIKIQKPNNFNINKKNENIIKTPLENYNKLLNNKLSLASLTKNVDINNSINMINNKDKIASSNCFTSVQRKKKVNLNYEEEEKNKISHTIESNKYIYNKKNILKKIKINKKNLAQERPLSATPIYKRVPALNPSLYQSNLKKSNSFLRKQSDNININNQNNINNNDLQYYEHKLNRYYSYGLKINTPSNSNKIPRNTNDSLIKKVPLNEEKEKNLECKKYIKKLNVKSYKIKNNKDNNKNKDKKLVKKRININTGNNNSGITFNNSNAFLHHIKNINTPHNSNNPVLNCYLSPKCNNSQVFNNFYSINCGGSMNVPVKVINVYKK